MSAVVADSWSSNDGGSEWKPRPAKWTAWNIAFEVFLSAIIMKGFVDAEDPRDVDV
jgi:hypothetical protein